MKKEYINIPFSIPDIGDEEINAVVETLRTGWITTGPQSKKFEDEFKAYLGGNVETIAVNSATSGLHLALESLGVGVGDEVIVPTLTFTATAEVVRYLGADPVLVDIDPTTMNIDPAKILTAITSRTKVIIPVHYAGLACQMDVIFSIAKRHNLKVIEDAAHALSSTYNKKMIGELQSDITVFSFYANKNITTGEGGMVVTRNISLAKRMKIMRIHGIDRDAFDRFNSSKSSWNYKIVAPGFKYNLSDIMASMGRVQLRRLPEFLKRREVLARRYIDNLSDLPLIMPSTALYGDIHAWHLFVIRLKDSAMINGFNRDKVIKLLSGKGIGTSVHYTPLHRHPYWKDTYNLDSNMFPLAEKAFQSMISIPLYTLMSDKDQDYVISTIRGIFK